MSNAPDPRLDAYLDGRMTSDERKAFEDCLREDAALREMLDRQNAIDASLRRVFTAPPVVTIVPSLEQVDPPASTRRPRSILHRFRMPAAIAAVLVAGVLVGRQAWELLRPQPVVDMYAPREWSSFTTAYRQTLARGFKPVWICRDERQFRRAFEERLHQPLLLAAMPQNTTAGGLGYSYTLTPKTINVLGRADGTPIMVFVDRVEHDFGPIEPPPPGLNLFRREIENLVLYELTPLDEPRVLPYFYTPSG